VETRVQINQWNRLAQLQSQLLDDEDEKDLLEMVWIIAEQSHTRFISCAKEDELLGGVQGTEKGVALVSGQELFIERIDMAELDGFKKKQKASDCDFRLLGNFRDAAGRRHLEFSAGVELLQQADFDD
jgi:hypothetical protein